MNGGSEEAEEFLDEEIYISLSENEASHLANVRLPDFQGFPWKPEAMVSHLSCPMTRVPGSHVYGINATLGDA